MFLFEVAWEVCNQVGGIYTVIRSKVPAVMENWNHDNYCLLGPYVEEKVGAEFDRIEVTSDDPIGRCVNKMRSLGFDIYYGYWLVTGRPKVVLFNPYAIYDRLADIKYEFWDHHHISLDGEYLTNNTISFGFQVKEFFKLFSQQEYKGNKKLIAHFHEWMAGTPIPEIKKLKLPVRIVFTTHATMLGRYLAMNDPNFYGNLPYYDWVKEAHFFNTETPVYIERAAAHGAHVFTTVSDVTAIECKYLVGREIDGIMPNGLNIKRFQAVHEFQNLHIQYKHKIHEFVMGHFFPSYSFDLEKTQYFFTSGRFEFHNKGYNLTLEALARLNYMMKRDNVDKTVVAFFVTPQPYHSINQEVINSRFILDEIRNTTNEMMDALSEKLFMSITSKKTHELPDLNGMIEEYMEMKLRRFLQSWKSKGLPKVVTHNMMDDSKDEVLNFLRSSGLLNHQDDKVKVIYYPEFISQTSPLFRIDYSQFVRGCNLGIFPSYYEPWGYTPLECIASGIPAVTSDLSGFGNYVMKNINNYERKGIFVTRRMNRDFYQSASELAHDLMLFVNMSLRERITLRNNSEETSTAFGWRKLISHYLNAYEQAADIRL